MIYIAQQLAKRESAADKREFLKGYTGTDKVSVKGVVSGVIAAWLLTGGPKK